MNSEKQILKLMNDKTQVLESFLIDIKATQLLWALQDKCSNDWVVLDSPTFENTDVMPVWSSKSFAQLHCVDEWQDYQPCQISLADWFEFWLEDLNEDGVIIGINWQGDDDCVELELSEFSQSLASVESLT
jgi:hypothetical protein